LFAEHEWIEEGKLYREAMIPATELNRYRSTLRVLTLDEEDAPPTMGLLLDSRSTITAPPRPGGRGLRKPGASPRATREYEGQEDLDG
jgi:hypothetical protein